MDDALAGFRKDYEALTDEELMHMMAQFREFAPQHVAAKQLLRQRENKRDESEFSKLSGLSERTLWWTKVGVCAAIVAMFAAIVAAWEGWKF